MTIIELLVSVAIFAILTTVVIFNFRSANHASNLRQNAAELMENLRRLQTMSISGAVVGICSNFASAGITPCQVDVACGFNVTCGVVPKGGYGLYIGASSIYKLFADLDGDGSYSAADYTLLRGDVMMSDKVFFDDYQYSSIVFAPPRGAVVGAGDQYYCLKHDAVDVPRKVTVSVASGSIREEAAPTCP